VLLFGYGPGFALQIDAAGVATHAALAVAEGVPVAVVP
jgi:hypothetical protein